MPTARLSQTIGRPATDVFATIADLTTFPEWNPTTVSATKLTDGPPGLGSRFELAVRGFGKQQIELTEFEEGKRVCLTPHSSMFSGGHTFTLTEENGQTRVDHELTMNAKGVWVLMTPLMGMMSRRNLKKTSEALQRHLEA